MPERTKQIVSEKGTQVFAYEKVEKPKYGKGKTCPNCGAEMALQDYMRMDFEDPVNPWRCGDCGYLDIEHLKDKSEELKSV